MCFISMLRFFVCSTLHVGETTPDVGESTLDVGEQTVGETTPDVGELTVGETTRRRNDRNSLRNTTGKLNTNVFASK